MLLRLVYSFIDSIIEIPLQLTHMDDIFECHTGTIILVVCLHRTDSRK